MQEQWYFIRDTKKIGPLTWEQLQEASAAGRLQPTDMVIRAGAQKWQPAGEVAGLFSASLPTYSPLPANSAPVKSAAHSAAMSQHPAAADRWFYIQDGKKLGPIVTTQLTEMARAGKLLVNDMVLRVDQTRWQYAGDIANLFPPPVDDAAEGEDEEEVDVDWHLDRAADFQAQGNYLRAIGGYVELVRLLPDEPEGYQGLAWIWATCPDAQFRNGPRAVEYASRAVELVEKLKSVSREMEEEERQMAIDSLETLAAAHAEVGDFEAALVAMDRALAAASKEDQARLRYRRLLFQAKKPCREGGRGLGNTRRERKQPVS